MIRIAYIIILLAFSNIIHAIKATPLSIIVTQPDGSKLQVKIYGDEYFSYSTTNDGYIIAQKDDGYYYYADYSSGQLKISTTKANDFFLTKSKTIPSTSLRASYRPSIAYKKIKHQDIKILCLLVEFSDTKFSIEDPKSHFNNFLNQTDYSSYGADGSVKDYFRQNLSSHFSLDFVTSEVISLPNTAKYYGANSLDQKDEKILELIQDACHIVNSYIDLSEFDKDNDGVIDALTIIHAGHNEAEGGGANTIWPQYRDISYANLNYGGININSFGISSEFRGNEGYDPAGIGIYCHELGHILGLPDLYDTDGIYNGRSKALWGKLSLMDEGNFNNEGKTPPYLTSVEREILGILQKDTLMSDKDYSFWSIGETNRAGIILSENKDEYFLFETRGKQGWDKYIEGEGLLIYHIDKSQNNAAGIIASNRWSNNLINSNSDHECANIIEAYHQASEIQDIFFPGRQNINEYSQSSTPSFIDWNGNSLKLKIHNISYESGTVFLSVESDTIEHFFNAYSPKVLSFQTEAILSWQTETEARVNWGILLKKEGEVNEEEYISTNKFYEFTDLDANSEYNCRIFHMGHSGNGDTLSVDFSTLPLTSSFPYIGGLKSSFKTGDIIYLRAMNIPENTKNTSWHINGVPHTGGRTVLNYSTDITISLDIEYEDNSNETIMRKIKINK